VSKCPQKAPGTQRDKRWVQCDKVPQWPQRDNEVQGIQSGTRAHSAHEVNSSPRESTGVPKKQKGPYRVLRDNGPKVQRITKVKRDPELRHREHKQ